MTAPKKTSKATMASTARVAKAPVDPRVAAQAAADAQRAELEELYRNVRNPKPALECRIFPLPAFCSVRSVAMRELDGEDDLMAAYWADQHADAIAESAAVAHIKDQREGIRMSLVGVDGAQVNEDGVPYMDCDGWTSKTWRILMQCFAELNGVSHDDLKNAVRGSQNLGAPRPASAAPAAEELDDE